MTHAEELSNIAARLAEIAKEMASQPALSKICAIGEVKSIKGNRYKKAPVNDYGCAACAFFTVECPGDTSSIGEITAIENGGSECRGAIWVLA